MAVRKFDIRPAERSEVPLLVGIIGPPGGGKTLSSLLLAQGMQKVRPGPIVLIDTERRRAAKYADVVPFLHVDFEPPFVPEEFLLAVREALKKEPAAIIIDSMSDEHEGDGGVLDWHDRAVPEMGGNEWAAWSRPKASRRRMISGFLQVTTPLIMTFRAREKTKLQPNDKGKQVPVNIGYQPIAPSEVVYALDVTCILPPRANGVPVWRSDKAGEDFIIKLPQFLYHCFQDNSALDEKTGQALAEWAAGKKDPLRSTNPPAPTPTPAPAEAGAAASPQTQAKAAPARTPEEIAAAFDAIRATATNGMVALEQAWLALPTDLQRRFRGDLGKLKSAARAADNSQTRGPNEPTLPME